MGISWKYPRAVFLIFPHKWVPMDIWIWLRPYLRQSGLNQSRYNKVRVFDEFTKERTREFHENFTGHLLIFSHKWVPMDIWNWSRPHLGQLKLNQSRYNKLRFFDEFSKRLVHGNFFKISPGRFFWYFHINGFLWIYEFGHDHIWGSWDWIRADIIKFDFLTNF